MGLSKGLGIGGSAIFGFTLLAFTAMTLGPLYTLSKSRAIVQQNKIKVPGQQTKLIPQGFEAGGAELIEGIFGVANKAFLYAPREVGSLFVLQGDFERSVFAYETKHERLSQTYDNQEAEAFAESLKRPLPSPQHPNGNQLSPHIPSIM